MANINWSEYLVWREQRGMNNADIAIFIGSPCEVKTDAILMDGESLVQVQIGGKANVLVPMEMIEK